MKKLLLITVFCLTIAFAFGQSKRFVSLYGKMQLNSTQRDIIKHSNPWSIGFGVEALFNTGNKCKPLIDITKDAYLLSDKVLYTRNGVEIPRIDEMNNILAGLSYQPIPEMYISFVSGASFINDQVLLAVKPSMGFSFTENRRWVVKVSYINVFDRDKVTKQDFGSVSFSLAIRVF